MSKNIISNMKIGLKLGWGFGLLLAITLVLGILAIFSMNSVTTASQEMDEQYIPEFNLSMNMRRMSIEWARALDNYSHSYTADKMKIAKKAANDFEKDFTAIQALSRRFPGLTKLAGALPSIASEMNEYIQLTENMEEAGSAIVKARVKMDQSAALWLKSVNAYVEGQDLKISADIRANLGAEALLQRSLKLTESNKIIDLGNAIRIANFKSQALGDYTAIREASSNFKAMDDLLVKLRQITFDAADIKLLDAISMGGKDYQTAVNEALTAFASIEKSNAARAITGTELRAKITELAEFALEQTVLKGQSNSQVASFSSLVLLIGLIIAVILGLVIAVILTGAITTPLKLVTGLAAQVTMGDFNIDTTTEASEDELGHLTMSFYKMVEGLKVKAKLLESIAGGDLTNDIILASDLDGLGKSMTLMQDSLNDILGQVNVSVEQIAGGSDQVSTASQTLSQGATEQAASLEEISASSTEIHNQSRQNADTALQANQIAKQASKNAELGSQQMSQLMTLMEKMNQSSEDTKKIVKTIDDIAFQVNLLALNANVEAARAGKYGKGFAVVAEEVRNLAVRSGNAVKETNQMVETSIQGIQGAYKTAQEAAAQLNEIVTGASKVSDFLEEIAAASQEQAKAMGQINGGLDQIDQVTQSNTASAEESASASEELSSQAQQLKAMVSRFQLKGMATNGRGLEAPRAPTKSLSTASGKRGGVPVKAKSQISLSDNDFDTF